MAGKTVKYTEPAGYFPKELRDKILAAGKKAKTKSGATESNKLNETEKKPAAKKPGKSPKGNSWAQVEAVARKIGSADNADVLLSADVYVSRAKKAGKTDAEIAKMTKAQLMKL